MAEATYRYAGETVPFTAVAAVTGGEVLQVLDGRAAVAPVDIAAGYLGSVNVCGIFNVTKTSAQVWIKGAPIWWDHSANAATCVPQFADRDFYLGAAQEDVASGTTDGDVAINVQPSYIIDSVTDDGDTVPVLTAGTPYAIQRGGMLAMGFSATAEAQKLDWISKRSFTLASNWVVEALLELVLTCDADVGDLSVGVANATHASDMDSATESALFHLDLGADLNIDAESDDGTTEVAATDTTIDIVAGTPVYLVLDGRDPSNVKYYINGAEVLAATSNLGDIQLATGPLKALIHLEKSSNDSPGDIKAQIRVRTMELD